MLNHYKISNLTNLLSENNELLFKKNFFLILILFDIKNIAFEGLACFTVRLNINKSKFGSDFKELLLASNPTPGYYSKENFPPSKKREKDYHLYLVVKNKLNCFQDIILRHTHEINAKFNYNLHLAPGQMTVLNQEYQCVRINGRNTNHLRDLIDYLKDLGIDFLKDRKISSFDSIVYYKKYIEFLELSEGVYKDNQVPGRFYFAIPKNVDFELFEEKVAQIKNNCKFHLFDSFLTHFFFKDKVQDFVGIYSEHCDETRFEEFEKELVRLFK